MGMFFCKIRLSGDVRMGKINAKILFAKTGVSQSYCRF